MFTNFLNYTEGMASKKDLFETAVGLLVRKVREEAKRLQEDEMVREIDDIKFQLNAIARSHLLTSITFFKEGMLSLFKLFNKIKLSEHQTETKHSARQRKDTHMEVGTRSDPVNMVSRSLEDFKMTNLDEDDLRVLSSAKKDFKQARIKATEAFNNEALYPLDRIQAIAIRVAAKILENVDHPDEALPVCKLCLEDLHSLKEVQDSFGTELNKGFYYRFNKEERRQIISSVCRINRAVYDVASSVGKDGELLTFPLIDNGKELVNPLHDARVVDILAKLDMKHYSVTPLSLGQTDGNGNKLKIPQGIAANSQGYLIVGDEWNRNVKVFDSGGKYQYSLPILSDSSDSNSILSIVDVAIDSNDNVYVLVELQKSGSARYRVYEFDKQAQCRPFLLSREEGENSEILRLTVSNNSELLALIAFADSSDQTIEDIVEVYNTDGHYERRFGGKHVKSAQDVSVASDGRIIVLDRDDDYVLAIHVFHSDESHSFQFKVKEPLMTEMRPSAACYQVLNHIVIAVPCMVSGERDKHLVKILIYAVQDNKHEFVRSIELQTGGLVSTRGITVTVQGHIAVGILDKTEGDSRVLVV